MNAPTDNSMKLRNGILSIAPIQYIDALLTLHKKLDSKSIEWAVGGDFGEVLRTVNVEPDCIEILTSKDGVEQIAQELAEYNPKKVALERQQIPRNAVIEGNEYPVYGRSYYSDFNIGAAKVKVHGDLQYRINGWDWGDKLEFTPEYVYVVGKKTAVVPLAIRYELHRLLGWTDRAEKIKQALENQLPRRPSRFR